jgi:hypothetical protein
MAYLINWLQDRAVLKERTKELAAERSSLRKMAMDLDRERLEVDKAKHKYEVLVLLRQRYCSLHFNNPLLLTSFNRKSKHLGQVH